MQDLKVSLPILKALLLTAGKNDRRTFLNGIHFEHSPHGAIAITTDGHRMTCARLDYEGEEFAPFTLRREMISGLKSRYDVVINHAENMVSITSENGTLRDTEILGAWPEWRRVIPDHFSGEPASYNYDYLGDVGKAMKLLSCESPALVQNGGRGAMIELSGDIIIIIMPMRENEGYVMATTPPLWVGRL